MFYQIIMTFAISASVKYPVSPQKRPPFYLLNNCQKLTDFNNFWYIKY